MTPLPPARISRHLQMKHRGLVGAPAGRSPFPITAYMQRRRLEVTINKIKPSLQPWSYLIGFLLLHFSSADASGINAEQPQFTRNRLLQKKTRLSTSKNLETSEEVAKRSRKGQVPAVQGIAHRQTSHPKASASLVATCYRLGTHSTLTLALYNFWEALNNT